VQGALITAVLVVVKGDAGRGSADRALDGGGVASGKGSLPIRCLNVDILCTEPLLVAQVSVVVLLQSPKPLSKLSFSLVDAVVYSNPRSVTSPSRPVATISPAKVAELIATSLATPVVTVNVSLMV